MNDISVPENIKNLFQNKRVCIVAGGKVTPWSGLKIDDDYDVVVRLNNIHYNHPFSDEVVRDYGKRCDVLFREHHQMWGMMNEMGDVAYAKKLLEIGIKDVIIFDGVGSSDEIMTRLSSAAAGAFNSHQLTNECGVYPMLSNLFNPPTTPTTGLMAIATIAMCEPRQLSLYGFTFYHDFVHDNIYYPSGIEKQKTEYKGGAGHQHKRSLEIFCSYLFWLCPIVMDNAMYDFISEKIQEKLLRQIPEL